jgi:hypothetical protein
LDAVHVGWTDSPALRLHQDTPFLTSSTQGGEAMTTLSSSPLPSGMVVSPLFFLILPQTDSHVLGYLPPYLGCHLPGPCLEEVLSSVIGM